MTDTPTPRYGARQQSQGSNTNTWGDDKLNEVLRLMDRGSKGVQTIVMTGDQILSWTSYVATNTGQCAVLLLTGSLSVAANLVVPSVEWQWDVIKNSTGQTVTVKTSAGVGVAIANGQYVAVYCDATDCYNGSPTTLPGAVTVNGKVSGVEAGTAATDAINKTQMEAAIAIAGLPATSGTQFASSGDTTPGYAVQKHLPGVGIDINSQNPGANESLLYSVDTSELPEFLAENGTVTATIANVSTPMTARRRYAITGTGPAVLPILSATDSFVIVEFKTSVGVTSTVGRNGQTIDAAAADDTYVGDGRQGHVIRYSFVSAGVVTSRVLEGVPA